MREKVHVEKQKELPVKLICIGALIALIVAALCSVPDEQSMRKVMDEDVRLTIAEIKAGEGDSTMVTAKDWETMFDYFTLSEYHNYRLFSVINVTNRVTTETALGMLGIFGTEISIADWRDYINTDRPMPKGKSSAGGGQISTEPIYTGHDYNVGTYENDDY